jgi:hypothetical protein
MLFIDAKEQVLRRLGHTSSSVLKHKTGLQSIWCDFGAATIRAAPSDLGLRHNQFMSYLVTRIDGPMEIICRSQLAPSYHADSLKQQARKQCFLALATSFYGLAHAQSPLVNYGRQQYLKALNMVNATISSYGSSTDVSETLSSVVALCLHEVSAPRYREVLPIDHLHSGHCTDTRK